jgi:hypothetical protein
MQLARHHRSSDHDHRRTRSKAYGEVLCASKPLHRRKILPRGAAQDVLIEWAMGETKVSCPNLFASFWMAGFESATHINPNGERVDMITGTEHDRRVVEDYGMLAQARMRVARDAARWYLIDRGATYDFSSLLPTIKAAADTQTQVIWNLCHYGWPDGLDVFSAEFVDRFAHYAKATARVIADHSDAPPMWAPINEISFFAWAASREMIYPFARGRDDELKTQLVRAAIAATEAVWDVDRRARIVFAEPVIHVFPPRNRPELAAAAAQYNESQYEAWDMLAGRKRPEIGGADRYLDVIGANYYHSNQWELEGGRLRWEDEPRDGRWIPFHKLIRTVWDRYQRPLFVAETSHFGAGRPRWIREIGREVYESRREGTPVEGVCLFPILDRYDWENRNHWHNSGLWDLNQNGAGLDRVINREYAEALTEAQDLLAEIGCQ